MLRSNGTPKKGVGVGTIRQEKTPNRERLGVCYWWSAGELNFRSEDCGKMRKGNNKRWEFAGHEIASNALIFALTWLITEVGATAIFFAFRIFQSNDFT
jgi:hypothetical protein